MALSRMCRWEPIEEPLRFVTSSSSPLVVNFTTQVDGHTSTGFRQQN